MGFETHHSLCRTSIFSEFSPLSSDPYSLALSGFARGLIPSSLSAAFFPSSSWPFYRADPLFALAQFHRGKNHRAFPSAARVLNGSFQDHIFSDAVSKSCHMHCPENQVRIRRRGFECMHMSSPCLPPRSIHSACVPIS